MKTVNEAEPLCTGDAELEGMVDIATSGESSVTPATPVVPQRAPLPWIGSMPGTSFGVMAVVNEDGYLVPVCTTNDLLRACKIIWQATDDRS